MEDTGRKNEEFLKNRGKNNNIYSILDTGKKIENIFEEKKQFTMDYRDKGEFVAQETMTKAQVITQRLCYLNRLFGPV